MLLSPPFLSPTRRFQHGRTKYSSVMAMSRRNGQQGTGGKKGSKPSPGPKGSGDPQDPFLERIRKSEEESARHASSILENRERERGLPVDSWMQERAQNPSELRRQLDDLDKRHDVLQRMYIFMLEEKVIAHSLMRGAAEEPGAAWRTVGKLWKLEQPMSRSLFAKDASDPGLDDPEKRTEVLQEMYACMFEERLRGVVESDDPYIQLHGPSYFSMMGAMAKSNEDITQRTIQEIREMADLLSMAMKVAPMGRANNEKGDGDTQR